MTSTLINKQAERLPIFLLHFAGGSCYSFDFLKKYSNAIFELIPLELPGRGRRHNEKPLYTKKEAIDDYLSQIKKLRNNSPYILYGHSMGATLGLHVAHQLELSGDAPMELVVSGNAGPEVHQAADKKENKGKRYLMDDEDFKIELRELGGIPNEVLENDDLYNFFSPIMRADFEILEKEENEKVDFMLKIPIYACMGSEEEGHDKIENWKRFTHGRFRRKIFEGNHFFINNHPIELIKIFKSCLQYKYIIR